MFKQLFLLAAFLAVTISSPVPEDSLNRNGRIVGGSPAPLGRFPYMVSLGTTPTNHFCGGAVISNRWALTAAHCTINRGQTSVRVNVGKVNLNIGGQSYVSSRIVNHPNYDRTRHLNDIACVQTASAIVYSTNVQPIALGADFIGSFVMGTVTGWGSTTPGGPGSLQLMELRARTISNADCVSRIGGNVVHESTLCTWIPEGAGVCHADSGGPLVANNFVIGVANWVAGGCASGHPDGYARVSSHRSWIIQTTR